MALCHILLDVGDNPDSARADRIARMRATLEHLGYLCEEYGKSYCNEVRATNLVTQVGVRNGWHADFADRLEQILSPRIGKGDLIIATEAWQSLCFRGLLGLHDGRYLGAPVVELWIDYPDSFATYRVFSTRYAMYTTAAREDMDKWVSSWITAFPYYDTRSASALDVKDDYSVHPFSLEHLEASRSGMPVCAPDWGAWAETICHGVSGLLYRSDAGHAKTREQKRLLDPKKVIGWVEEQFSLERAASQLKGYLKRLSHA